MMIMPCHTFVVIKALKLFLFKHIITDFDIIIFITKTFIRHIIAVNHTVTYLFSGNQQTLIKTLKTSITIRNTKI